MGLVSDVLAEDLPTDAEYSKRLLRDSDKDLHDSILKTTRKVVDLIYPENPVVANRMYQHILLTQLLIILYRKPIQRPGNPADVDAGGNIANTTLLSDSYFKSYLELIAQPNEMTNITYWDKDALNEIDSQHLKISYRAAHSLYYKFYELLMSIEGSPYLGKDSLDYEEFLWAFNTVSQRHLVLHNHDYQNDPNLKLVMLPFMDLLNHAREPNCGIVPFIDKLDNNHSYFVCQALRDI